MPGDVVLQDVYSGEWRRVKVVSADPVIAVSEHLLEHLDPAWAVLDGDVLTIRGFDRTVIYRIDRASYDSFARTYLAEWPD